MITKTEVAAACLTVASLRIGDRITVEARAATVVLFSATSPTHVFVRYDGRKRKTLVHGHLITGAVSK